MSGRNDGRFNSTMKSNSGRWNNSPNRSNSYNGDRNNSYYGGRNNSYQGKNNSYSDKQIRQETTLTAGTGTTKAGTPGTITLIIMIPGED